MRLNQLTVLVLMAAVGQSVGQADVNDPVQPAWVLSLDGDHLTVHLDEVPLRRVLAELARQGGFRVQLSERLDAPVVSAHFERLPLEEGLERLLAGWSYAVFHAASPGEPGRSTARRITEVLLLAPAGPPQEAVQEGYRPDATAALESPGPQTRIQALEQWVAARDGSDIDPLTHALVDPDEQVRARAQALASEAEAARFSEPSPPVGER
jgi:hypothetical protein